MSATAWDEMSLEQYRRFYAEEIRIVGNVESEESANAFATVPRENFVGPPPWKFFGGPSVRVPTYRTTSDTKDLYHDVFVALKPDQLLNNGQPSVIARLIAALNLAPGKRVLHIGCGSGYYTAIMSEVVGPTGSVLAVEVEPDLAERATTNLAGYSNVEVRNRDAATLDSIAADAIISNAGMTHPHPLWLQGLNDGGVLVLPIFVGKSPTASDALALCVRRQGNQYAASWLLMFSIYASPSQRDPAIQTLLNNSLEDRSIVRLQSIRVEEHEKADTCIVHTPGFCLSAEPVEGPRV